MRRRVLALGLTVAGATWAAGVPAARAASHGCPAYIAIPVRGTGDHSQPGGKVAGPVIQGVQQASNKRIVEHALKYPATHNPDSLPTGVKHLRHMLSHQSQRCPGVKFIIAGQSQGAQVISLALAKPSVPAEKQIAAITLTGDPNYHGTDPWDHGVQGPKVHGGAAGQVAPHALDKFKGHIWTACNLKDNVCNKTHPRKGLKKPKQRNGVGHGRYAKWRQREINFILKKIGGHGSSPAPDPASCPATIGVAVDGLGNPGGGGIVGPVIKQVKAGAWQPIAEHDLAYTPTPPPNFKTSRTTGDHKLDHYLSHCQKSKFFLVGWGEGALVIADELHHLTVHRSPVAKRIVAVALNGDPAFNGSEPWDRGSYRPDHDGLLSGQVGSISPFSHVIGSWCLATDPICQHGAHGGGHAKYKQYRTAEVNFVLKKLGDPSTHLHARSHPAHPGRRRHSDGRPFGAEHRHSGNDRRRHRHGHRRHHTR